MTTGKREFQNKKGDSSGRNSHFFQVAAGVLSFYFIVFLYDSKGFYFWSKKLPVNDWSQSLVEISYIHWQFMAKEGFEEPKHMIETFWLDLQEAHPLNYPKKMAEIELGKAQKIRMNRERQEKWNREPQLKSEYFNSRDVSEFSRKNFAEKSDSILIIGDSLMMTVGPILKESFEKKFKSEVTLRAKLATGLARPDVFDWVGEVDMLTAKTKFKAAIVMIGTNDSQDFLEKNNILIYGTPEWVNSYRRRIRSLMEKICDNVESAVWIGLPPMKSRSFHRKVTRLNQLVIQSIKNVNCMHYLDTFPIFGDEAGQYLSYKKVENRNERIRMTDGIHITRGGASLLIDSALGLVKTQESRKLSH